MTPKRPFLIRAMHEWMTENSQTPQIIVDASSSGVAVPSEYVEDGKIVLNISWQAVDRLEMGNDEIAFSARFGGRSTPVRVPVDAVLGIYARESGEGMVFADAPPDADAADGNGNDDDPPPAPGGRGHLKIVK